VRLRDEDEPFSLEGIMYQWMLFKQRYGEHQTSGNTKQTKQNKVFGHSPRVTLFGRAPSSNLANLMFFAGLLTNIYIFVTQMGTLSNVS